MAAFRTWAGATNQADARARVYLNGLPAAANQESYTAEELDLLRPCALIWTDENDGYGAEAESTSSDGFDFDPFGKLVMTLEQNVPLEIAHDPAEVDLLFKNDLGLIIDGLFGLFGQPGYLAVTNLQIDGPWRVHPDDEPDQGDWIFARFELEWGRQQ